MHLVGNDIFSCLRGHCIIVSLLISNGKWTLILYGVPTSGTSNTLACTGIIFTRVHVSCTKSVSGSSCATSVSSSGCSTSTLCCRLHPRPYLLFIRVADFISIAFCLSCTSTLPFRVWMPVWCTIAVLSLTVVIPKYLQLCCTCISCYIFVSSNSRGLFLASTGNSLSVTVLAVLSEATFSEVPSAFEIFVNLVNSSILFNVWHLH